jgi:hypothetical protein
VSSSKRFSELPDQYFATSERTTSSLVTMIIVIGLMLHCQNGWLSHHG